MGADQYSPNVPEACIKSNKSSQPQGGKYAEDVENEQACMSLSSKLKNSFKKQYTASKDIMNSQFKKQWILKNNRHNRYRKLMETPTNESIQSPNHDNLMAPIFEAISRIRVITPTFRMIEVDPKQFIIMRQTSILKDYDLLKQIGKGSFGSVYRAKERITGELRAVKKISKQNLHYQTRLSLINQFQILRKLDHPNIIKLYEMYDQKEFLYVVTQLCEGGNLLEYVTENKTIPQDDIRSVMLQLLGAVRYMHDCKILHRDIKLENIVLIKNKTLSSTQHIQIKLIDFGISIDLAKNPETETDTPMGTLLYMSPESIQNKLMLVSDVYSCGVVLYIMATHRIPFIYRNETELMYKIKHGNIVRKYLSAVGFELKLFLACLIERNPKKRIKARAAMKKVWLTKGSQKALLTQTKRTRLAQQMLAYDAKNNLISLIEGFLVCRTINQEQRQRLATLFDAIDADKSGVIQVEQFKKFYYQNSQHYDSSQIEQLAELLDKNKSGNIDFNEFITAMYCRRKLFQIQSLEIAFDFLDKDSSGGVSKAELQEILKGVQHQEMDYLFKEVDKNQDKSISKAEFLQYFRKYQ